MKTIKIIIASCLASLCWVSMSFAEIPVASGWYVEGNAGITELTNTNYGRNAGITNNGFGLNLNAGYKFMPFFGAEIGASKYADTKIKSSVTGSATAETAAFDIAGKAILPIGGTGTELFTKIGVATVRSKITTKSGTTGLAVTNGTHTGTNFYLGAGAEYAFTANTSAVGQWAMAKGDSSTGTFNLFSIGVSYLLG